MTVESFNDALREALYAIDRPFVDISAKLGITRKTLWLITKQGSNQRRPHKSNAVKLTDYLSAELDDKIRHHIKEVRRLKEIKSNLLEGYESLYPEKKNRIEDES